MSSLINILKKEKKDSKIDAVVQKLMIVLPTKKNTLSE